MAAITLRSVKGSPLTIAEVDQNFSNLNIEVGQKLDASTYTAADILDKLKSVDSDTSGLNATTLKSMDPSASNVSSTIVMRNTLGSFSANEITANAFIGNVTGNASGTALNVTGTVAVINGGTGANSPSAALDNLLPSGETAGYVLKTSGPGTYYWAAETGATTIFGTRIDTSRTTYTATAGQTVFTGTGTYTIGSGQLRVYINGVRQFPDAYTETSTSSFTLTNGVAVGTKVMAEVDANASYTVVANAVTFTPTGNISSTNVQNAIAELDTEKAAVGQQFFLGTTQVAINRTSGALTLSGVTVDNLAGGAAGQIPYQTASGTTAFTAAGTSGQVLKSSGTGAPVWGSGGGFNNMVILTSGSSYTFPSGVTKAKVTIIGGGGGGGRGTATTGSNGGSGGCGGAGVKFFTFPSGATATYTVGTGGAGSASVTNSQNTTAGSAGTSTTITIDGVTATATGGSGGSSSATTTWNFYALKGANGTTTGVDLVYYAPEIPIVNGSAPYSQPYIPAYGQISGTWTSGSTYNAPTGNGYGTGGGSGGNGNNSTSTPTGKGGDGAPGVIILEF